MPEAEKVVEPKDATFDIDDADVTKTKLNTENGQDYMIDKMAEDNDDVASRVSADVAIIPFPSLLATTQGQHLSPAPRKDFRNEIQLSQSEGLRQKAGSPSAPKSCWRAVIGRVLNWLWGYRVWLAMLLGFLVALMYSIIFDLGTKFWMLMDLGLDFYNEFIKILMESESEDLNLTPIVQANGDAFLKEY